MTPDKDPQTYTMLTYAWMVALSLWGGTASYVRKVRMGMTPRFSLTELVGELVISGFSGIVTFYLCQYAEFPMPLTAAMVGISGHMGSRVFYLLEQILQKRAGVRISLEQEGD